MLHEAELHQLRILPPVANAGTPCSRQILRRLVRWLAQMMSAPEKVWWSYCWHHYEADIQLSSDPPYCTGDIGIPWSAVAASSSKTLGLSRIFLSQTCHCLWISPLETQARIHGTSFCHSVGDGHRYKLCKQPPIPHLTGQCPLQRTRNHWLGWRLHRLPGLKCPLHHPRESPLANQLTQKRLRLQPDLRTWWPGRHRSWAWWSSFRMSLPGKTLHPVTWWPLSHASWSVWPLYWLHTPAQHAFCPLHWDWNPSKLCRIAVLQAWCHGSTFPATAHRHGLRNCQSLHQTSAYSEKGLSLRSHTCVQGESGPIGPPRSLWWPGLRPESCLSLFHYSIATSERQYQNIPG